MVVLRSGKHVRLSQKYLTKSKQKKLFKKYSIKECSIKLHRINVSQQNKKLNKYNLRSAKNLTSVIAIPVREKKVAISFESNTIWNSLVGHEYLLAPSVIVLAKMNNYRPWPARINTIYKVGNQMKCFVLFYGTFQIGSVLKEQCVSVENCGIYLAQAVAEIKLKFKWKLNYDEISKCESNRAEKIAKLTQVQKFLLAVRDVERLNNVPLELSLTV